MPQLRAKVPSGYFLGDAFKAFHSDIMDSKLYRVQGGEAATGDAWTRACVKDLRGRGDGLETNAR
eukprot:1460315-Alexandrium_andersonii.AAC.1